MQEGWASRVYGGRTVGLSVVGKVIWHLPDGGRVVGLMDGRGSTDIVPVCTKLLCHGHLCLQS